MMSSTLKKLLFAALLGTAQTAPLQGRNDSTCPSNLTYITLEEHYATPASVIAQAANPVQVILNKSLPNITETLLEDIGQYRIPNMNNNSIKMSILSHAATPVALSNSSLSRTMNEQLASAISAFPSRLRGFCFLPMADPSAAAAELEHCITSLHFIGALIDAHLPNLTFYDSKAYDVFWETAQRLNVPIYLHPTYAPITDITAPGGRDTPFDGDYSQVAAAMLSSGGYGWHVNAGLSFLRLWLGGISAFRIHSKLVISPI